MSMCSTCVAHTPDLSLSTAAPFAPEPSQIVMIGACSAQSHHTQYDKSVAYWACQADRIALTMHPLTDEDFEVNEGLLACCLKVSPEKTPRRSTLTHALGRAFPGIDPLAAEVGSAGLRRMLAHVRRLVVHSQTSNSYSPVLLRLKRLVVHVHLSAGNPCAMAARTFGSFSVERSTLEARTRRHSQRAAHLPGLASLPACRASCKA